MGSFCREQGLAESTFYAWRKRLRFTFTQDMILGGWTLISFQKRAFASSEHLEGEASPATHDGCLLVHCVSFVWLQTAVCGHEAVFPSEPARLRQIGPNGL